MAYIDYRAPGVTVIVERQPAQELVDLTQFYPVFVGQGMTSRTRDLKYEEVGADTSAFPEIVFNVGFSGKISSDLYDETTCTLKTLTIRKDLGGGQPATELIAGTDYEVVSQITAINSDGQGSLTVRILNEDIAETDLVYDVEFSVENTDDDFEPKLVLLEDQFYARDIFGPYVLNENNGESDVKLFNDIALAAEIAFRSRVPAFYYVEVPREYGSSPTDEDYLDIMEKIYYKRHGYRVVPLTSSPAVIAGTKALVESISNPLDKRESVSFVTYDADEISNINSMDELVEKVGGLSEALNSPRVCNIFCGDSVELDVVTDVYSLPPYFMAAAIAAFDTTLGMTLPLTRRAINVFKRINVPKFRPRVWNQLAAKGVWIVTQEDDSEPIVIRHQLTTSQSNAAEDREYSIVKNLDAITKFMRERLEPYSGQYNITDGYLEKLDASTTSTIEEIKEQGLARNIVQISPWTIRTIPGTDGEEEKTNLVTRMKPELAYPANNLDIYLLI